MKDSKHPQINVSKSSNLQKTILTSRNWTVLGGLLSVALGLVGLKFGFEHPASRFIPSAFSRDYALCSPSYGIYTVDESRPRVECVVVSNSYIIDTGSLGMCINNNYVALVWMQTAYLLENVRSRWNEQRKSSRLSQAVDTILGGPKVIHVQPGSIVVPGLAGILKRCILLLVQAFNVS